MSFMDTGIGMEEETHENPFEINAKQPSRNGLRGKKGTGLGLDLVLRYTKIQGEKIDVESYPGTDSIFNLYLPKTKKY
ncbi:MAG: ATP-binding protein [Candidatus Nanoarchaeia archaeon]